jgi:hypothetical protein
LRYFAPERCCLLIAQPLRHSLKDCEVMGRRPQRIAKARRLALLALPGLAKLLLVVDSRWQAAACSHLVLPMCLRSRLFLLVQFQRLLLLRSKDYHLPVDLQLSLLVEVLMLFLAQQQPLAAGAAAAA